MRATMTVFKEHGKIEKRQRLGDLGAKMFLSAVLSLLPLKK